MANYRLDLEYDGFLFMRIYTGKGTFYLNNDKSKFLKLYLDYDFEIYRLYDYIEHDIIIKDIDYMLQATKESYPAIYRTRLDVINSKKNFYRYNKNIPEYLSNYNAVVILTILHYIENDNDDFDYQSYCDDFSKDVYSSITSNLDGINPFVEFIFFKKEPMYNNPLILDITSNNHCCYGSMQCNIVESIKGCTYTSIRNKKYYCCIID